MFILFTTLLTAAIFIGLYISSQLRKQNNQLRFNHILQLRQLIALVRQHRTATHFALSAGQDKHSQLQQLQQDIHLCGQDLLKQGHSDNKSLFRILNDRLTQLTNEWPQTSVARNQLNHGRLLRQVLFILDEVMIVWLIDSKREDISNQYHKSWQKIIDSLEVLTRFRIAIADIDSDIGKQRLIYHCSLLCRRVDQLCTISPVSPITPEQAEVLSELSAIHAPEQLKLSQQSLYLHSQDLSLLIFNVYDQILSNICDELYQPLPSNQQITAIKKAY